MPTASPLFDAVDGSAPKPQVDALEQITRQIGADLATVSLVMLVAVSVAAVVVAASISPTPRKAGP